SGDLDQDPVLAHRADDGLAPAKLIDALANDLDSLVQRRGRDFLVDLLQFDQKGSAPFDVETERDFPRDYDFTLRIFHVPRRINHRDAERDRDEDKHESEDPLPGAVIGREVPAEKTEPHELDEKHDSRTDLHFGVGIYDALASFVFRTLVTAVFSISSFTLSATFTITVVSFTFEIS